MRPCAFSVCAVLFVSVCASAQRGAQQVTKVACRGNLTIDANSTAEKLVPFLYHVTIRSDKYVNYTFHAGGFPSTAKILMSNSSGQTTKNVTSQLIIGSGSTAITSGNVERLYDTNGGSGKPWVSVSDCSVPR